MRLRLRRQRRTIWAHVLTISRRSLPHAFPQPNRKLADAKSQSERNRAQQNSDPSPTNPSCKPSSSPIFPISEQSRSRRRTPYVIRAISGTDTGCGNAKKPLIFSLIRRDKPVTMSKSPNFDREICLLPLAGWSLSYRCKRLSASVGRKLSYRRISPRPQKIGRKALYLWRKAGISSV